MKIIQTQFLEHFQAMILLSSAKASQPIPIGIIVDHPPTQTSSIQVLQSYSCYQEAILKNLE